MRHVHVDVGRVGDAAEVGREHAQSLDRLGAPLRRSARRREEGGEPDDQRERPAGHREERRGDDGSEPEREDYGEREPPPLAHHPPGQLVAVGAGLTPQAADADASDSEGQAGHGEPPPAREPVDARGDAAQHDGPDSPHGRQRRGLARPRGKSLVNLMRSQRPPLDDEEDEHGEQRPGKPL